MLNIIVKFIIISCLKYLIYICFLFIKDKKIVWLRKCISSVMSKIDCKRKTNLKCKRLNEKFG